MTGGSDDLVGFAEKLLSVLDRGSFTSTYKYAVLLGLIDVALERTQKDGAPPTSVTTEQLAGRVIELYWPHARAFPSAKQVLFQNLPQKGKKGGAEIVTLIEQFRAVDPAQPSLHRARAERPGGFAKLVREVEWKLVEMPLPRVQVVGRSRIEFLYSIGWVIGIKRSGFNARDFDNRILFLPGAAESLVRLSALLRPLIQREWAALIARFNALPQVELEEFLFRGDRSALGVLREPLVELQAGACFYCERPLQSEKTEVDHFVPWSRHPNDAIENLVAAHHGCNGSKSDHLAASAHLQRWVERNERQARSVAQIAAHRAWASDPEVSLGVARGIYLRLPEDTRLWRSRNDFESSRHAAFAALFA